MDNAYYNWIWLLACGAIVGLFMRARTVAIVAAVCMAIAVGGLVISALSNSNTTMLFGIAAMGIPVLGGLAAIGSLLGNTVRAAFTKRSSKEE
jgi:hypothetical protein